MIRSGDRLIYALYQNGSWDGSFDTPALPAPMPTAASTATATATATPTTAPSPDP